MDNREIARSLREIADLLEIKGENTFRVRSYRVAADSVEASGEDVAARVRRGEDVRHLPGIGEGMAQKIGEMVTTGSCTFHRELAIEVPAGLLDLLKIPGLGPKGVALVWRRLGVSGLDALEAAIADGRFRTLPGMKEKKEAKILKGLADLRLSQGRFLLHMVGETAARLARMLRDHGATAALPAGSFRRRRETVGDLDIVAVGGDPETLAHVFTAHEDVKEVLAKGATKSSIVLRSGLQVDLRHFLPESLGAALQYFTGSKAHNVALRERAVRRGLKLNEYGVYEAASGRLLAGEREEDVYATLGLAWIPPELREARGEIEAAEAGALPVLVTREDLQGDLHVHTTESDGRSSLSDMVEAARRQGHRYVAITDHTRAIPSPTQGTGMDEARCLTHLARIRALQASFPDIRILAGVEACILPDGRLDMDDDVLSRLDLVVGSLHSRLGMDGAAMTDRLLRAFSNPHMDIWGHPTGRLLLAREPVAFDLERVLDAAARCGITIEINSQPDRLDAGEEMLRAGLRRGIRFVVSTDSHSTAQLDNLVYGVGQARRGWLTAKDVLNTRSADELIASLRRPATAQDAR